MTRAQRIEEAARALLDAMDDNVPSWRVRSDALRSALASPASAPRDEYRRGVEDAARECGEVICEITKPGTFVNHATMWPQEILRRIRALSPPADAHAGTDAPPAPTQTCERCGHDRSRHGPMGMCAVCESGPCAGWWAAAPSHACMQHGWRHANKPCPACAGKGAK